MNRVKGRYAPFAVCEKNQRAGAGRFDKRFFAYNL
jgi:hypothetical protein